MIAQSASSNVFQNCSKMSQARVFTLLGDSNIHRNKTSIRANPVLKASQIVPCGHLAIFNDAILKIRSESNVCIVSCLTNFLASSEGPESVSQRLEPVLSEVRSVLDQACLDNPGRFYLISPPMYRTSPVWYREGLPEVMTTFSQSMLQDKPANLLLLPSFPTPAYVADGVHLTPYSGLEFMMHLFDSSEEVLSSLAASPEAATSKVSEGSRLLEDRVMVLEQDHRRLNQVVENKIAIDSEISDFHDNERHLDWFVIAGLKPIHPDLFGKAWQDQAVKDVQAVVKLLMGKKANIVFVKNATPRFKDAEVTYNVQLREVSESQAIRDKFGAYFVGGDKRPANLKKFSIRNRITPGTKVRIAVLQVLAKRYKTANPGAKVQSIGFAPRPLLKITPASDASDRRVLVYNFVEAVKALPTNFNSTELDFIMRKVNPKLCGQLRSIFVCLSDDDFRKRLGKKKSEVSVKSTQPTEAQPDQSGSSESSSESEMDIAPSNSSQTNKSPEQVISPDLSSQRQGHKPRTQKRGATSSPGDGAPSKK